MACFLKGQISSLKRLSFYATQPWPEVLLHQFVEGYYSDSLTDCKRSCSPYALHSSLLSPSSKYSWICSLSMVSAVKAHSRSAVQSLRMGFCQMTDTVLKYHECVFVCLVFFCVLSCLLVIPFNVFIWQVLTETERHVKNVLIEKHKMMMFPHFLHIKYKSVIIRQSLQAVWKIMTLSN